uniref:biosynthetic-type acetolactate synthase large subunit n=1 Tax=Massilibacillus massiliensis TaxID=1806837 RepID=UPI000B0A5419|nr:biosynthetic-type acetolactate synthase large subunit [Massilibacillus massiliensis]
MKITGAKAVVKCLLEQGVHTVFGYPGGMILPLYNALYDESNIQQVLTFHEQGAAHAADGYARASGKVGVCMATSGPGATNLVTGLATAFMDSVPVVAITGQVETALLGRDAFQEIDIMGVSMPITKHNFQVKDASKLCQTIRLAFKVATSGRPGPVLVDIPRDILNEIIEFESKVTEVYPKINHNGELGNLIQKAAKVIQDAKKPVIVAGGGVISACASDALISFAEKCHLPVVTTLMGIGGFPRTHKQSLGMTGMHGLKVANHAVFEADVVIAVGSRFGDRLTGNRDKYSKDKHVIHIDIDPAEIDKNVMSSIGLAGDMKLILQTLMQMTTAGEITAWWNTIEAWEKTYELIYNESSLNVPWAMQYVAEVIKEDDIAVVTDVGQHQMWAAQHLKMTKPRTWITSGGLGTMGFGLPAAMGAQIAVADRGRRILHIAGDGGIKMTGNEYYTIATLGLPIISIIVNNNSLGMIKQLQKVFYKERYIACELPKSMDFAMYAMSLGIHSVAVDTPETFKNAFQAALASDTPQVIVMNVDDEFVKPMTKAGAEINEFVDL